MRQEHKSKTRPRKETETETEETVCEPVSDKDILHSASEFLTRLAEQFGYMEP